MENNKTKINLLNLLPSNFIKLIRINFLDFDLYEYQLSDLLIELEDILFGYGNSLTRERARQSGKTTSIIILSCVCMIILPELAKYDKYLNKFPNLHLFKNGFTIGIVAPLIRQAKITIRRIKKLSQKKEFRNLLSTLEIEITNNSSDYFALSNNSSIIALSGNPISVTEGESLNLLLFDEAHQIHSYSWYKAYTPMVSSTNGTIIAWGIAWTKKAAFYNQIQINKKLGLHSRIIYTDVEKISEYYKKWIKKELTRISKDSIEFQLNFLLIWKLKSGNPITPEIWDDIDILGNYNPGEATTDNLYFGIDWGKTTTNTFVTLIEKGLESLKIIDLLELWGDDYPQQHLAIQKFINQYPNFKRIWSESTGVGDTNTDFLKAVFSSKVVGVTAFNLPTLHDKLLNEINYKRLIRPRIKEFGPWISLTRQFINCEKKYKGTSFQLIAPNDELDDAVDSVSLAIGAALNEHIFDFTYKKRISTESRILDSSSKRIMSKKQFNNKDSKYKKHLSLY